MDSREILPDTTTIRYILDTKSLDSHVAPYSPLERLLHYTWHDDFSFYRTPEQAHSSELDAITSLSIDRNPEETDLEISWDDKTLKTSYFPDRHDALATRGDYTEPQPETDEIALIDIFESLTQLSNECDLNIFITERTSLLRNRYEIEHEFCKHKRERLHLMSAREAVEFTGIYFRNNNEFKFYPPADSDRPGTYRIGRTNWCWSLSRLLIPHFSANEYLGSMIDRIESLCVGIDEIGTQHYRGTGNHTDIMVRYHFNNCISLLTGIGDVLALHTRDMLDVDVSDRNTNLRVGSNPVLQALKEENEDAWLHVQQNHPFIELLHIFRNDIIHQSGVIKRGPGHTVTGDNMVEWGSHSIWLTTLSEDDREDFKKYYTQLDDSVLPYELMTEWGIITPERENPTITEHTSIDAYQFTKRAVAEMVEFVDEYLRLLGFPNRIRTLTDNDRGLLRRHTVETVAGEGLFPLIDDLDPSELPGPVED